MCQGDIGTPGGTGPSSAVPRRPATMTTTVSRRGSARLGAVPAKTAQPGPGPTLDVAVQQGRICFRTAMERRISYPVTQKTRSSPRTECRFHPCCSHISPWRSPSQRRPARTTMTRIPEGNGGGKQENTGGQGRVIRERWKTTRVREGTGGRKRGDLEGSLHLSVCSV